MSINAKVLSQIFGKEDNSDDPAEVYVEAEVAPESSPYDDLSHTDRTLAQNPLARSMFWVGLVGGFAVVGLWISSTLDLSTTSNTANSVNAKPSKDEPEDKVIKADTYKGQVALSDQDVAQEKSEAFLEAERKAKEFEANSARNKANSQISKPPQPSPKTVTPRNTVTLPSRPPQAPRAAFRPRPSATPRPRTTPAPRPSIKAPPAPKPSPQSAPKQSTSPSTPKIAEQDPYQLYAQLGEIGSYGSTDFGGNQSQGQNSSDGASSYQGTFNEPSGDIYLQSGSTVKVQLELPIIWSSNSDPEKSLAVVSEGSEFLPAGTQVLVTAQGDTSGVVRVSQLEILDQGELIPLSGSMQITKENSKPLVAKRKGGPGFFAKNGVKTLLGLASNVAGSAISSGDNVTVNTGSGSVNANRGILSDALQGGADTLLGDLESRNKDAIQRQQDREYFIVSAGESLVISAVEDIRG